MSESKRDDGGPAFPISVQPDFQYAEAGMSLRDWFAGQCIEQCIRNAMDGDGGWDASNVAHHAYLVADAMLAERGKEGRS